MAVAVTNLVQVLITFASPPPLPYFIEQLSAFFVCTERFGREPRVPEPQAPHLPAGAVWGVPRQIQAAHMGLPDGGAPQPNGIPGKAHATA